MLFAPAKYILTRYISGAQASAGGPRPGAGRSRPGPTSPKVVPSGLHPIPFLGIRGCLTRRRISFWESKNQHYYAQSPTLTPGREQHGSRPRASLRQLCARPATALFGCPAPPSALMPCLGAHFGEGICEGYLLLLPCWYLAVY